MTSACSTGGGSAAPQATVTVTAHPKHDVTAGPSVPATPVAEPTSSAPASSAPAAPAACSTRYLGATVGTTQGAAGSTYVELVFKNLNNYPCTLYGYPGVALDAGKPATPVGLSASENPATPRELVTLGPYGTAEALLQIRNVADYSTASCKPVSTKWLQIIPPNQYAPIYLGYTTQTCAGPIRTLTVSTVRPASGSS